MTGRRVRQLHSRLGLGRTGSRRIGWWKPCAEARVARNGLPHRPFDVRGLLPVMPPEIESDIATGRDSLSQAHSRRIEFEKLHRGGGDCGDSMKIAHRGRIETRAEELRAASGKMPTGDSEHRLGRLDENGFAVRVTSEQKLRRQARTCADVQHRSMQIGGQQIDQAVRELREDLPAPAQAVVRRGARFPDSNLLRIRDHGRRDRSLRSGCIVESPVRLHHGEQMLAAQRLLRVPARSGGLPPYTCQRHPGNHPLRPLITTAWTTQRCSTTKITRIGRTLSITAAVSRLYSMKYMLVKLMRPTVTTFICGLVVTTMGQKNSFQLHMNLMIRSVAMAGFTDGSTTEKKIPSSLPPSMRAASM